MVLQENNGPMDLGQLSLDPTDDALNELLPKLIANLELQLIVGQRLVAKKWSHQLMCMLICTRGQRNIH
jgi:hypothetical protein